MHSLKDHLFVTWRKQKDWEPINVVKPSGSYFYDLSEKKY